MLLLQLLLLLLMANLRSDSVKVDLEVVENGDKLTNIDALNDDTRENEVVPLVSGQRVLESVVQVHDFLEELVEGWITNGC